VISILRRRVAMVAVVSMAALTLAVGLGTPAAVASTSQVCGLAGSGYCLNDWGGGGQPGDAVNMYYGGTANDDFYVQEVNRCNGYYKVTSSCPFGNSLDSQYAGDDIVQIVYTNNQSQCVATMGGDYDSTFATLNSCANPVTGAGGADGVIDVISGTCYQSGGTGDTFVNRYWSTPGSVAFLDSGGAVGAPALFEPELITCWGGFTLSGP
jgi:hypothetical protein